MLGSLRNTNLLTFWVSALLINYLVYSRKNPRYSPDDETVSVLPKHGYGPYPRVLEGRVKSLPSMKDRYDRRALLAGNSVYYAAIWKGKLPAFCIEGKIIAWQGHWEQGILRDRNFVLSLGRADHFISLHAGRTLGPKSCQLQRLCVYCVSHCQPEKWVYKTLESAQVKIIMQTRMDAVCSYVVASLNV